MAELKKDTKQPAEIEQIDFVWKGKDKAGTITKGEIAAKSLIVAKAELRRKSIRVISIKKKPKDLFAARKTPIETGDIAIFARQLATMLQAGVALVQSFDIIGKGHENASMREMLLDIKASIEGGDTLAESLGKYPIQFDELFCNLVAAGEQAGILETLLGKLATYKEKSESMRKKIKKAMTYPISVLVVAGIVTSILLLFVVPVFEELFQGFGADLPAFTQFVVGLSRSLQETWWMILGVIFGVKFTFKYFKERSRAFNHFLDRMLLKMPAIGVIIEKSAIARFSRTLSTMSAAGVPLIEALTSVAGACGNIVFFNAVMSMRDDVATGQQLQFAMERVGVFPHMVIQMVAIGEESGAIDTMLEKVADFYDEEVDNAVDNLTALMEPIIMAFLGVVIGGLIIAMYLPIFKMGSVV